MLAHARPNAVARFPNIDETIAIAHGVDAVTPRMMTVAVHCRLAGKPGRAAALARFVDHVLGHGRVWICRRLELAEHWHARHPPA